MKNTLIDIHNHLVAQLEVVTNESIQGEQLKVVLARARVAAQVAGAIIGNARVALDAARLEREEPGFTAPRHLRADEPDCLPARRNGAGD